MNQDTKVFIICAVAVIIMVGGAFLFAFNKEQDKMDCIANGHVYIEDHCYKSFPMEDE